MSIRKIVALLIPTITLIIWAIFFAMQEITIDAKGWRIPSMTRFTLVIFLIPLMFISFYIALRVWSTGKPKSKMIES